MTRRDYVLIAESFRRAYSSADEDEKPGIAAVGLCLMTDLKKDNPRFDLEIFLEKSGLQNA